MEVTALCFRLLINMLILLVAKAQQSHPQTSDADIHIVPSRLQLFEYESVSFTCEGFVGSAGWKVRNIKKVIKKSSDVTSNIKYALPSDSGEYWCEGGKGQRSNTINITVTGGSVILESPVLPVMEGEAVTLRCRNKTTSSNLTADFYKDGIFIKTDSTGNMTIHSVSKCDEGLYKCSISGAGESPESWLAVRGGDVFLESPVLPVIEGAAVTLRCRKNKTSFGLKADFYKDGHLIRSNSTGEMIINSVSKSDEGHYKCSISGAGESAERWLSVKVEIPKSVTQAYLFYFFTVVKVLLALQLLVIGLLYWKKQQDTADAADNLSFCLDTNHSSKPQTEKDTDEPRPESFHSSFSTDDTPQALQNEWGVSVFTATADPSTTTDLPLPDQDSLYSTI